MHIAFAVFCLLIAHVACYPSFREAASDNDDDFELELRSILNDLDDEQMARSVTSDEDDEDDDDDDDENEYLVEKRNIDKKKTVDPGLKCEIECVHTHRHPKVGKGKSVKEAAKICAKQCPKPNKKHGQKKTIVQRKHHPVIKALRELIDNENSNNSEEEQVQRREFYDYLMEQLQQNDNE